jgi:hypothetical protein
MFFRMKFLFAILMMLFAIGSLFVGSGKAEAEPFGFGGGRGGFGGRGGYRGGFGIGGGFGGFGGRGRFG